jgi:hypothetical protein
MSTAAPALAGLDLLLRDFIAGEPFARNAFPRDARRYLLTIARKMGRGLPDDILLEVVSQALESLLRMRPGAFDPQRGSAGTFLGLVVRTAVRTVRANYAPPGEVTRQRKPRQPSSTDVEAAAIPTDEVSSELNDETPADEAEIDQDQEVDAVAFDIEAVDPRNSAWLIEVRHDVRSLLQRASPLVAEGLVRVHACGDGLAEVALDLGVSRFALNRQINRYLRDVRAAA